MYTLRFCLLLVSFSSCQNMADSEAAISKAEVLAFLHAYDAAWNKKDHKIVDSLYGTSYRYFTSVGGVSSRARNLEILVADYYRLDAAKRTEIEISVDGNTAVVSSRWKASGRWRGAPFDDNQRCGLVIQKQGSQLKLLSEHCVDISTEPSFE